MTKPRAKPAPKTRHALDGRYLTYGHPEAASTTCTHPDCAYKYVWHRVGHPQCSYREEESEL